MDAVAHVREKMLENNPDSEMENRIEQETKKAKAEPAQCENTSAGGWRVRSLEAVVVPRRLLPPSAVRRTRVKRQPL